MNPAKSSVDLALIVAFLAEVPLFAGQNPDVLTQLAQDLRLRTYRNKEIIFHQGDLNRSLYIVMTGKLRVYHLTLEGEETTVNILARRQLLGEFNLIDGQARSATVQAISACLLLEMQPDRMLYYLEHIPGLALAMCRQLTFKARWTSAYAETIARFDAARRLQHLLLLYNEQFGQAIEPGKSYQLDLGLSQGDLATLVGATRGWVNDILQRWRRRGIVEFCEGKIMILDLPELQKGD
ncbi:MAG: Crp/Fnr family transcriptional regulator [Caldilineaceae bacterium]